MKCHNQQNKQLGGYFSYLDVLTLLTNYNNVLVIDRGRLLARHVESVNVKSMELSVGRPICSKQTQLYKLMKTDMYSV